MLRENEGYVTCMPSITKATATPEQWAAHLEYHRLRRLADPEGHRAKMRAYHALPHVKALRAGYDKKPGNVERRRAYHQTPEAKARAAERYQKRKQDPNFIPTRDAKARKVRTGHGPELVAALLVAQGNCCAICKISFEIRKMVGDHCHSTDKPRGLLCRQCNFIDGMLVHAGIDPVEFGHRLVSYRKCPPALKLSGSPHSIFDRNFESGCP